MRPTPVWSYGVTTVPERRLNLLPRTLKSLAEAGFGRPRLFIDRGTRTSCSDYAGFSCPITHRDGEVGPFMNWWLSLVELYGASPQADRFAIFQDDLLAARNLREYLDSCEYPARGYWNLYTAGASERVVFRPGWVEGPMLNMGATPGCTDQKGIGALALVFSREAVWTLLSAEPFVKKPAIADHPRDKIDGGVVGAMNSKGWREWVHGPSLVYHTGMQSSISEPGHKQDWDYSARTWAGEGWDAVGGMRELLAVRR